jgi:ABC-type multidrug transport system ATPase subunit
LFQDQVTALLGHNGAGKTTTISILTGMLPASSGTATINNMAVDRDMWKIRRSLGLCPQFDILWPSISVRDHLWLYATIKGLSG